MFKRVGLSLTRNLRLRPVHTHPSSPYTFQSPRGNGRAIIAASALAVGAGLWYSTSQSVHNDATVKEQPKLLLPNKPSDPALTYSLVWGSNTDRTLCPDFGNEDALRTPTIAQWLNGVALRDLQLAQTHAACIDARGDVFQWGRGFFGQTLKGVHTPKITLKGKNIVQLQLTDDKLYALSASGRVYVLATDVLKQELRAGAPTPASDSWWSTGMLWGEDETVDFVEILPSESLGWRESFVSIAAGKNHLLALTSKGRVLAHPINKKANEFGQLGFRKISISDPGSAIDKRNSHLHVDLIPKSLADPYAGSSRSVRVSLYKAEDDDLTNIDDKSIRFCTHLFEIPALRGVEIAQIATGGRSSFVRTPAGRVLGWGANEYGQIGLGSNITVDTITVPTEVVLWRSVGNNAGSKCLKVVAGGDLAAFIVERESDKIRSTTVADLLMCGNGQYGGLGNNLYTNAQGNPTRLKTLSGLEQYNDRSKKLDPITPDEVAISPTGHVLLTLNSVTDGVGGKDLMVWGRNFESELGLGKRSNVVVPTPVQAFAEEERLMLTSKKAEEVRDLHGRVWKRGVNVKQQVVAGYANSVVYWKIDK